MNIERNSSKLKLLRVTSLVLRFASLLKAGNQIRGDNELGDISASELKLSEDQWVKSIQRNAFKEEYHKLLAGGTIT